MICFSLVALLVLLPIRPSTAFPSLVVHRQGAHWSQSLRKHKCPTRSRKNRSYFDLNQAPPTVVEEIATAYAFGLEHYPFPTQSATAGIFAAIGDILAQSTSNVVPPKSDPRNSLEHVSGADVVAAVAYNPERTLHYFLKGLGGGILWTCWFNVADYWSTSLTQQVTAFFSEATVHGETLVQQVASSTSGLGIEEETMEQRLLRTFISILLEQFLVCPIFYSTWDIPIPALLRGTPLSQIPRQIQSKIGPLLVANAQVWTPVNIITYNIPSQYRVLFTSCADIVWQSFNSQITSSSSSMTPAVVIQELTPSPSSNSDAAPRPPLLVEDSSFATITRERV